MVFADQQRGLQWGFKGKLSISFPLQYCRDYVSIGSLRMRSVIVLMDAFYGWWWDELVTDEAASYWTNWGISIGESENDSQLFGLVEEVVLARAILWMMCLYNTQNLDGHQHGGYGNYSLMLDGRPLIFLLNIGVINIALIIIWLHEIQVVMIMKMVIKRWTAKSERVIKSLRILYCSNWL